MQVVMEEALRLLEALTTTPGGIIVLIILLVFVGGMIWLAGGSRRQTSELVELLKQLAANGAKQTEATDKFGDALVALKSVLEQQKELVKRVNVDHNTAHARVDDQHGEIMSGVDDLKSAVGALPELSTHQFTESESNIIAAIAQAEASIIEAIREDTTGETLAAVQELLQGVSIRVDEIAATIPAPPTRSELPQADEEAA